VRFVIETRLRQPSRLTVEQYFALAVREWEVILGWLARGPALACDRPVSPRGTTVLVEAGSEAEARALAASLPLAPHAELIVRRSDVPPDRAAGPAGPRSRLAVRG
jgi:hypothetical protein